MFTTLTIQLGGGLLMTSNNHLKGFQNIFKNNTAQEHGGGVLLVEENILELNQCVLEGMYITVTDIC